MDFKEIKLNCATGAGIALLINTICKLQAIFFGHAMRKRKLRHLMTIELISKEKAARERSEKRYSMD